MRSDITTKIGLPSVAACLGLLFWLDAAPAHASFGDCADPSYRARFDPRIEVTDYDCVERLRVSVPTEDGERRIRLLHDRNAGWALGPGATEEFERGVRAAATALGQIGPFRMDDVTVLLIDGLPPREGASDAFSDIAALTGASDGECRVGVYLLSAGGRTDNAAYVVAHEIFHCVQEATLSPAQMGSGGGGTGSGGDWWMEGSADWFAALALPELGPLPDRIARFDAVSPERPLHEMAYEAVVFFLWLNDAHGPRSILPFLRRMADRPGASAQRAAMAGALSGDEWLAFAEAYIDRRIKHPHGTSLSVDPAEGDHWRFSESRRTRIPLEPFVIRRGWIEFACGRWETRVQPDEHHAVRADGGSWGDLPRRIDVNEGDDSRFRFVGFSIDATRVVLGVDADLEAGCEPCRGISDIDACLVGAWRQSGGGPVEWMRSVMPDFSFPRNERQGGVTVLRSDGTYITTPRAAKTTVVNEDPEHPMRADGDIVVQASGRWSAKDGKLNLCPDSQSFAGQAKLTIPGAGQRIMPLPQPDSSGPMSLDYACSAGQFETRLAFPGIAQPMVTRYSKVGADLPGEEEE